MPPKLRVHVDGAAPSAWQQASGRAGHCDLCTMANHHAGLQGCLSSCLSRVALVPVTCMTSRRHAHAQGRRRSRQVTLREIQKRGMQPIHQFCERG